MHALKLGNHYIVSRNYGNHEFIVGKRWDPDPALSEIMTTLSEDEDRPIAVVLGDHSISIDPVIGCDLFLCLFAYPVTDERQNFKGDGNG